MRAPARSSRHGSERAWAEPGVHDGARVPGSHLARYAALVDPDLSRAMSDALGARALSLSSVPGGDVHRALRAELSDGRTVFVKTSARAPADLFDAEAHGLSWLEEAGVLRTPRVLAVLESPPALVLEWIEPGSRATPQHESLGRQLAALHRSAAPAFGLDRCNYVASIRMENAPRADWATFYSEARILPLFELAVRRGDASPAMRRGIEALVRAMPERVGPSEPPARLHGDLWGGNLLWDAAGEPVLIDPAVFGGHREIDLAMMRLFGGFSQRTFAAYEEAHPLAPGHEERVALYQLLPLLAHVVLFGGSYVASVERALSEVL